MFNSSASIRVLTEIDLENRNLLQKIDYEKRGYPNPHLESCSQQGARHDYIRQIFQRN